jgi:hypothetical protein
LTLTLAASFAAGVQSAPAETRSTGRDEKTHPIDSLLEGYLQEHRVAVDPVADRLFLRRVSLDLTGMLPTPEDVEAFVADRSPDKRARLVDRLLADREAYAVHWLTFWSDALRNAYRGAGFIDNGREQITRWLFAALYHNLPYDRFVHELISPVEGSAGFTRGIKWRGVVNESQRPEIQAAQNVAQVFLATNLKCASCHDSFVNDWTLKQAYELSSVFAEQPLEIHHCDKPTGETSGVGFIYPEVGEIDASASRAERMEQLADLVVHRENERFARTIVNRLWAQLMGRGIIEPRDNMDGEAFHPELLDLLARDLVEHGYDLKRTLRLIATSQAYQLPAVDAADGMEDADFVFRGPLVKRMTAEQFVDAVSRVTGVELEPDASAFAPDGRNQGGQLAAVGKTLAEDSGAHRSSAVSLEQARQLLQEARWIWSDAEALQAAPGAEAYFRAGFQQSDPDRKVYAIVTADNEWELFVNGRRLASGDEWTRPGVVEINDALARGRNVIAIRVRNAGDQPNPAGLLAAVGEVATDGEAASIIATGSDWRASETAPGKWEQKGFDDSAWAAAVELGAADAAPWQFLDRLSAESLNPFADPRAVWRERTLRAALVNRDTLQSALGRPNREQTVTGRESEATLLQALELTNGKTLSELLQQAAEETLVDEPAPKALIDRLFFRALGRRPSDAERSLAEELTGEPPTPTGVADLLWTVVNLPEFQLIY